MVWHAAVRHPAKLTTRSGAFKYVFNSGNDLTPYAVAAALVPKSAHRRWLWGRPKINQIPEPVKLHEEMPTVDELEKEVTPAPCLRPAPRRARRRPNARTPSRPHPLLVRAASRSTRSATSRSTRGATR